VKADANACVDFTFSACLCNLACSSANVRPCYFWSGMFFFWNEGRGIRSWWLILLTGLLLVGVSGVKLIRIVVVIQIEECSCPRSMGLMTC